MTARCRGTLFCCKMRCTRCVRHLLALGLVLTVVCVSVSTVRNALFPVPRAWRALSTWQFLGILTVLMTDTVSGSMVYLSPCLDPQIEFSPQIRTHISHGDRASVDEDGRRSGRAPQADEELYAHAKKWVNSSAERRRKYSLFLPRITIAEKARLLATWRAFHEACDQHNIAYFLVEGSLLGAFRHGGIIPWDDDIDVAVDVRDLDRLKQALSCVPGYTLRVQNNMHWKFFARDAAVVPVNPTPQTLYSKTFSSPREMGEYVPGPEPSENVVMRFPFVDIFMTSTFYGFTGALTNYILPTLFFPREIIYPLKVAPFEGYLAPVPGESLVFLETLFGFSDCVSPAHCHILGKSIDNVTHVPCKDLAEMYPMYNV